MGKTNDKTLFHFESGFSTFGLRRPEIKVGPQQAVRTWPQPLVSQTCKPMCPTSRKRSLQCLGQQKSTSRIYFKSSIMAAGFSRKDFHTLENLATVAPSMTLWSADQLTCMMCAATTLPSLSNLGNFCKAEAIIVHLVRNGQSETSSNTSFHTKKVCYIADPTKDWSHVVFFVVFFFFSCTMLLVSNSHRIVCFQKLPSTHSCEKAK